MLLLVGVTAYCQEKVVEKDEFSLSSKGKSYLEIRTPQNLSCDISIETHDSKTIELDYRKWAKAKSSAQGKRFIDLIEIQFNEKTRDPEGILLKVLSPTRSPWEGSNYGVGVQFDIIVPKNFKINSHNSYSSLDLFGPFDGIEVFNEYGSIEVNDVKGELIIKASHTKVELSRIEGFISVESRNAEISGEDIIITNGPGIFETSHGSINLENIQGSIEAHTSYSPVIVSDINAGAGSVILTTTYGPINAENVKGELVCETSYGPIELKEIYLTHGMNRIETKHAPVNISLESIEESQLLINNIYSSINVVLNANISAKLMLSVDEGGKIHTRGFPIKPLTMDYNRLVGIIGEGLSRIELNVEGIGEINIDGE